MFDWVRRRDINQIGVVFEKRADEQVVIRGVKLSEVDWGLELDSTEAGLGLEVPEGGATVLGGGQEVATAVGPTGRGEISIDWKRVRVSRTPVFTGVSCCSVL